MQGHELLANTGLRTLSSRYNDSHQTTDKNGQDNQNMQPLTLVKTGCVHVQPRL